MRIPLCCLCFIAVAVSGAAAQAVPQESPAPEKKISYYRSVRPILQRQCSGCHFAGKLEGGLSVIAVAELLKGGEAGSAVTVGKPDESLIIQKVSGEKPEMPLNGDPLKPEAVATIRAWIEQGAIDDTPDDVSREISAENPPVYVSPPVVTTMDYSPDGKLLAVSGYHEVLIHTLDGSAAPKRLIGRAQRIESLAFSPNGQILAVAGGTPSLFGEVQLWSVPDGKLLHSITLSYDTMFGVSFNGDGTLLAFGGADNRVRVAKVDTGELTMRMDAHSDWVLGTTFSLKDDHLISVSRDRSMKLTIVANGQFVDNITSITPGALKGGLIDVQRHPTREEVLAVGSDGEPRLYKIFREKARQIGDDFNLVRAYPALPGRLCDLDFSPSGNRFVVGSSTAVSGAARVYMTEDNTKTVDIPGLTAPVFAVSMRPDELQVAVAGFDGMVRLCNADNGTVEATFPAAPLSPSIPAAPAAGGD
jgi:WD40 repeat protein